MIISHKYKYLFIEIPRTGCSAISKELGLFYHGEKILKKHSNYFEFFKIASEEERKYFVFAGVRNPIDSLASKYEKYKTNHRNNYTDKRRLKKHGGWVTNRDLRIFNNIQRNQLTFYDFLITYCNWPFTNNISVNKEYCDYIIRFEKLDSDFKKVMSSLPIPVLRDLPRLNETKNKKEYSTYLEFDSIDIAVNIFAPFMQEWGYDFPDEWGDVQISRRDIFFYEIIKTALSAYVRLFKRE